MNRYGNKDVPITEGERFGHLVVIGEAEKRCAHRRVVCKCDCGSIRSYYLSNVRGGRSTQCVECRLENLRKLNIGKRHAAGYQN